ncbi:MAG: hypothetical protein AAB558_04685 [Patescibacteria group bacterium]
MLNEVDKKWIIGAIQGGIESIVPRMLEIAFEAQKKWIVEYVDFKIDELARMVAEGFEQCATKVELHGVTAQLGSLESRVAHLETTVVTKNYLDERLGILRSKEQEVHKQLKMSTVLLIQDLKRKKIIGPKRANTLVSMEPFPQKLS